ncbi:MAG: pirin family protein [Gammaproteobacteria bacterium]|nr:pirin family protein [Gammaproteobacteria bacterium]
MSQPNLVESPFGIARDVLKVIEGHETSDGAGVSLTRYIASPELDMFDPFLLLDAFRSDDPDDYIAGFPPHPHRGFETVTYLLEGNMRHKDSTGHEGLIRSGGVQWMTAGSGIEHSEMPEQEKGLLYGFQLWVNLPAAQKMTAPRYQEFEPEEIPVEKRADGSEVKVIAGTTIAGTSGAVTDIAAAPLYLDITIAGDSHFHEVIPQGHSAFIYVIKGPLYIHGEHKTTVVPTDAMALLDSGERLEVSSDEIGRFLLISGRPFNEPVARYGPFVMNTEEEIQQAFIDYRAGHFGQIAE